MNILLRRVRNDQNHGNGPAAVNHFRIPNNILCHPRWTQVSTIDLNHKLLHPISFDKHAKVVPWCLVDLHKGLASSKIIRLNIGLGLGHSLISTTTISSLTSSELPGLQDTSASSTSLCATCLLPTVALLQVPANSLFFTLAAAAAAAFWSHTAFLSAFWCSFSHLHSSCSQHLSCAFLALSHIISASFHALSSSFLVHSASLSHAFSSATNLWQYFL